MIGDSEIKKINENNKYELFDKLSILHYFNEEIKIPLFFTGNDHYKQQGELDLKDLRDAQKVNMSEIKAKRTKELHVHRIMEANQDDFVSLLDYKFGEAKRDHGYKTKKEFAKWEANQIKWQYSKYYPWFPILEQWVCFLEGKSFTRTRYQQREGGKSSKRPPRFDWIERAIKIFQEKKYSPLPTRQKLMRELNAKGLKCSLTWVKEHYEEITK